MHRQIYDLFFDGQRHIAWAKIIIINMIGLTVTRGYKTCVKMGVSCHFTGLNMYYKNIRGW